MKDMQSEEAREGKFGVANKCNEGGHTTLRQLRGGPPRCLGVVRPPPTFSVGGQTLKWVVKPPTLFFHIFYFYFYFVLSLKYIKNYMCIFEKYISFLNLVA
jgi:hypothetical protein